MNYQKITHFVNVTYRNQHGLHRDYCETGKLFHTVAEAEVGAEKNLNVKYRGAGILEEDRDVV